MTRRAVITGLGIVSPIGVGVDAFWRAALEGRSGIGRPTLFDASKLPPECQIVGEVRDFDPLLWMPAPAARMAGRFSQFAVAAARMALDDSGLDVEAVGADKLKVAIGTSMNGLTDVHQPSFAGFLGGRKISAWTSLEYSGHAASSHVAAATALRGQTITFGSACTAGLDAISWASTAVRLGHATAVLAGGSDAPISPATMSAFDSAGVLSHWRGEPQYASRPFDRLRSGLVVGEGAATVLVEDEDHALRRGARIYASVLGSASSSEGGNLRGTDASGRSTAITMSSALAASTVTPGDIDYISAHGNSMVDFDAAETAGIRTAFGARAWNIPISSLKSMCGQAFAAAGAMQTVACCLSITNSALHPTINYTTPDPDCDLDYVPNIFRRARVRTAMVHSHSIGGSHTTVIFGAYR